MSDLDAAPELDVLDYLPMPWHLACTICQPDADGVVTLMCGETRAPDDWRQKVRRELSDIPLKTCQACVSFLGEACPYCGREDWL